MSAKFIDAAVVILIAIVGVAALAVLLSKNSQTAGVLTASSGGFRDALCAALAPIGVKCGGRGLVEDVTSSITY